MSYSKRYSLYDVVSKDGSKIFATSVPTRKEAREIKNTFGNCNINQRTFVMVQNRVVR